MQGNNKLKVFEIDSEIVVWDIKTANLSICSEYKLLTEKQIRQIESMPKDKRVRTVGLLERSSKKFAKALEEHFDIVVNQFIEQNGLNKDQDIICIKKDAVFVINKNIYYWAYMIVKLNCVITVLNSLVQIF